jgi:predicted MPP superfamily phosphohydrolase
MVFGEVTGGTVGPKLAGGSASPKRGQTFPKLLRGRLGRAGGWGLGDLRTTLHDWEMTRLPSVFSGMRILHLSDLHLDVATGIASRVAERVERLEYDFCVITGDFRDSLGKQADKIVREGIGILSESLRGRVFFTLGNHDDWAVATWAEEVGMTALIDAHLQITREGSAISLCGVDDPRGGCNPDFGRFGELTEDVFSILLSHRPELAEMAERAGFDFMVAGHSHGGQMCFPGGIPLITGGVPRDLASGRWKRGRLNGYTSRGVGGSFLPVRINCPPEISVHRISSKRE